MSRIYDALKKAEQETKRTTPVSAPVAAVAAPAAKPAAMVSAEIVAPQPVVTSAVEVKATAVPPQLPLESEPSTPRVSDAPVSQPTTHLPLAKDDSPKKSDISRAKDTDSRKADKKKPVERLQIFSPDGSELLGAEEFRRLRTKLQHAREKRPMKTLLVTSAMPGEGKTFVTVNLAQTFTMQHNARVLVIDADFRKPQVHAQLRVPNTIGLSDYLEGRSSLENIIRRSANANLDYIAGGPVSARPAELAGSIRFNELLTSVADEYEWVLIDTPPVLPVTDASVIARYSDAVLLVVSAGQTPGDLAQAARKELQEANLVGVVLNRATTNSSSYKHYYYYSYSHGKGNAASAAAAR